MFVGEAKWGGVRRLPRGDGGKRASSAPWSRKKVQLDTLTEAPCTSDKPQRHEIAIQADGPSMGKLTLDLNVHHHYYHYPEQQPQQVQHYPGRGGHRGVYSKQNMHYMTPRYWFTLLLFVNNDDAKGELILSVQSVAHSCILQLSKKSHAMWLVVVLGQYFISSLSNLNFCHFFWQIFNLP